jgi:hypothetical protein
MLCGRRGNQVERRDGVRMQRNNLAADTAKGVLLRLNPRPSCLETRDDKPAASRTEAVGVARRDGSVAEIVQRGLPSRKLLPSQGLRDHAKNDVRKILILLPLQAWLAALDDFRNWLIREAA